MFKLYNDEYANTVVSAEQPDLHQIQDDIEYDSDPQIVQNISLESISVLVIDDSDIIRETTVELLQIYGMNSIGAKEGEEGFVTFKEMKCEIILLDMYMPVLNGIEFLRRYRNEIRIPIIAYTGSIETKVLNEAIEVGADLCLTFPFTPDEIIPIIRSQIQLYGEIFGGNNYVSKFITVDFKNRIVKAKDRIINLTYTEFKLLSYLILNKNNLVLREKLLREIIGPEFEMKYYILQSHINSLIQKIEQELGKNELIEVYENAGYIFRHIE